MTKVHEDSLFYLYSFSLLLFLAGLLCTSWNMKPVTSLSERRHHPRDVKISVLEISAVKDRQLSLKKAAFCK